MCSKLILFIGALFFVVNAQAKDASDSSPFNTTALDPAYKLAKGDQISVSIFGEASLAATPTIDQAGKVKLPLVGEIVLAGISVRDAEKLIEKTYQTEEYLKNPQVTLAMASYAIREVTLLGAVRQPGSFQFRLQDTSMDIRDIISRQGGLTQVAKGDAVKVIRRNPDGKETTFTVNVDRMMSGRSKDATPFLVYPGDRIIVAERLF